MPLIVEDGTLPENANSYVSLEQADAYLVPRNLWPAYEAEKPVEPEEPELPDGEDGGEKEPEGDIETQADEGEQENNPSDDMGGGETGPDPETPEEPKPELPDTSKPNDDPEIAKKEAALMRAFDYLNGPLKWKGQQICWNRIPAWPRVNVLIPGTDTGISKPQYIEDNFIPDAICRAQMELAAFFYNGKDLLAPLERGGKYKQKSDSKSESVDVLSESASHSIAYAENAPIEDWLPSVYSLLRPYLEEVPGELQNGFKVHDILRG